MTRELEWLSAAELAELIAGRSLSPREVVEAALNRIDRIDPQLNAFLTVCADDARAAADRAEKAVMRGDELGPLHGVPVAIKDEAWTKGVRTTAGSKLFEDFVPAQDGTLAARLRDAGAILLGKTNVPEFMVWSRTANNLGPETVNPWDVSRSPGASSGGSGAAVAAGLTPIAIGSDGGGSIRIPAALCGVQGLHPTPGRVPDTGSFSYTQFASLGPMARSTRDLALVHSVIAGPDGHDTRLQVPAGDVKATLEDGVKGLRVAWTADYGYIRVDEGVAGLTERAVRLLGDAGARIDDPGTVFPDVWGWFANLVRGEAAFAPHQPYLTSPDFQDLASSPERQALLTDFAAQSVTLAPITRHEYEQAVVEAQALRRQVSQLFEHHDVIISPTMPVVAPVLPPGLADPYPEFCNGTYFTALANVTRLPAMSIPCGFAGGLPVGLQIMAPTGREDVVLRVARAVEQLVDDQVSGRRPPV